MLIKHPEMNNILDCDTQLWVEFNKELVTRNLLRNLEELSLCRETDTPEERRVQAEDVVEASVELGILNEFTYLPNSEKDLKDFYKNVGYTWGENNEIK